MARGTRSQELRGGRLQLPDIHCLGRSEERTGRGPGEEKERDFRGGRRTSGRGKRSLNEALRPPGARKAALPKGVTVKQEAPVAPRHPGGSCLQWLGPLPRRGQLPLGSHNSESDEGSGPSQVSTVCLEASRKSGKVLLVLLSWLPKGATSLRSLASSLSRGQPIPYVCPGVGLERLAEVVCPWRC